MGLRERDLKLSQVQIHFAKNNDRQALEDLRRMHGLAHWLSVIEPDLKVFWKSYALSLQKQGIVLLQKVEPERAAHTAKQREVQRIIGEYGIDELLDCVG
jgi:hypothetical protein